MGAGGETARARDIAAMVIGLALGSSLTPFVPVPFVDDWLLERLLRRIGRKVMDRGGSSLDEKALVRAYLEAGDPTFGVKAVTAVGRFVVRKLAVILDVKKSHDVFGEALAFALALDAAVSSSGLGAASPAAVGAAIHRSIRAVGAGPIDAITRAGRASLTRRADDGSPVGTNKPHARIAEEIGAQIDEAWVQLDRAMRVELR